MTVPELIMVLLVNSFEKSDSYMLYAENDTSMKLTSTSLSMQFHMKYNFQAASSTADVPKHKCYESTINIIVIPL